MNDYTCSGLRLKLTFMQNVLLQVVKRFPSGQPILKGLEANLLNSLARTLNFTYEIHETEFGQYGKMLPNKSWTGVVGHLSSGKADFALSSLSVTRGRRTVIDFSVPYIHDTLNFFVGVENATRSAVLYLSPFEVNVWIVELTCAILVLILLFVYFSFRHKSAFKFRSFKIVFGIAAKQDVNVNNIKSPASFVILLWLMTCTILNIFYGNALKASTSVPTKDNLNTLDDLASVLRLGNMKFFILGNTAIEEYIAKMPPTPYGDLFRRASEIRTYRATDFAEIYEKRITMVESRLRLGLRLLKRGYPPSKVRAVNEPLMTLNTAIGFRRNFTCQGSFNWVIIGLSESGCLQKWKDELVFPMAMQDMKDEEDGTDINYIGLSDLRSTFCLLFISYLGSLVVITLQLCKRLIKCLLT